LIQAGPASDTEWLLRRTTWTRSIDYERAANPLKQAALMIDCDPTPTIVVLGGRLGGDLAREFLGRRGGIGVPSLLVSEGIGMDGVVNGLETHQGRLHLEWWCSGPPEWKAVTEAVEQLRLDLDAVLARHAFPSDEQLGRSVPSPVRR
jgi:hypothetical protein